MKPLCALSGGVLLFPSVPDITTILNLTFFISVQFYKYIFSYIHIYAYTYIRHNIILHVFKLFIRGTLLYITFMYFSSPVFWLWDAYMVIYLLNIIHFHFCKVSHCMNIPKYIYPFSFGWIIIISILRQLQIVLLKYFLYMLKRPSLTILNKTKHFTLTYSDTLVFFF